MNGPHLVRTPMSLHRCGALQSWQKCFCQSIRITETTCQVVTTIRQVAAYDECQTPVLSAPHDVPVLKVVVAVHDGAAATWRPVIGRHGRLELRDFLPDFPEVEGCGHL